MFWSTLCTLLQVLQEGSKTIWIHRAAKELHSSKGLFSSNISLYLYRTSTGCKKRIRICSLIAFLSQELLWKTSSGNRPVIEKGILCLEFEIVKSYHKIHILQWNKLIYWGISLKFIYANLHSLRKADPEKENDLLWL